MTTTYAPTTATSPAITFEPFTWDSRTWALYRRACWLLRNLIIRGACTFHEAEVARLQIAEALGWIHALTEPTWEGPHVLASGSYLRQHHGYLWCGHCGEPYGRKRWHPGTPHDAFVFECPTDYRKRGTCSTPHIYQDHLKSRANLLMQKLCRNSDIPDLITRALPATAEAIRRILAARPDRALFQLEDVLAQVGCATVASTTRIIVETTTGETITIPLVRGWTPSRHR